MQQTEVRAINIERVRSRLDSVRSRYATATPFPHVVIDHALSADDFDAALAEFPATDHVGWQQYSHVNEQKFANRDKQSWGPTLQALAARLTGAEFTSWLAELTGFDRLQADPDMDGGGLHQTMRGGFLNVHTDFTAHHTRRNWKRRVNLILYLNPEWRPEWGGALELWDSEIRQCVERIEPAGNRIVIFTTADGAYHGHPAPLACPSGIARRSLALYYFTAEEQVVRRATGYRARPGDGAKGLGIWADRQVLALYDKVKACLGRGDELSYGRLGRTYRRITGSIHATDAVTGRSLEPGPPAVQSFFDRQQREDRYASLKEATRELDQAAALRLNELIRGEVLSVGGVWDWFEQSALVERLTVLDLSIEMLNTYGPASAEVLQGDLYEMQFADQRFDTVVFPLMLHHTPIGSWRRNERRVDEAIARAARWLRDDGHVIILEYCPHPAWQPLQRALLPITRRFLTRFGQPLVVMYTRRFYEASLRAHFAAVGYERVAPAGFDYWVWYPIFMGVRWLRMPLALYPKMHIITGRRARRRTPMPDLDRSSR